MSVQELTDSAADAASIPKASARLAIDAMVAQAVDQLVAGGTARIPGLGTFTVKDRKATTGRNPATGEPIQIAARRTIKFKPAKAVRDRLDESLRNGG